MTDNPPAFPAAAFSPMGDQWSQNGMSLRDWFAGQALAGFTTLSDNDGEAMSAADCAKAAYNYADAMLAERAKGDPM